MFEFEGGGCCFDAITCGEYLLVCGEYLLVCGEYLLVCGEYLLVCGEYLLVWCVLAGVVCPCCISVLYWRSLSHSHIFCL